MTRGREIFAVVGVFAAVGVVAFAMAWRNSGSHPVSTAAARRRFENTLSTVAVRPSTLRPPVGVYEYRGSGT